MSARCDLSDLPVEQCACRIHKPAEPEWRATEVRIAAKYRSQMACDHWAAEGDEIALTEDGYWVCGRCAS